VGFKIVLLVLSSIIGSWIVGRAYQHTEKKRVFDEAYNYARKVNKPVLNAGCGTLPPYGDVNLDITPKPVPNFILNNIENMPFKDKEFGACVVSHVLEHVDNPEKAYQECHRVADQVYLINPPLWDSGTWLTPTHKWLVITRSKPKFIPYNPIGGWSLILWKLVIGLGV